MSDAFPERGRIAGIDFGTVRVGVSLTDPQRRIASPLETYARRDEAADRRYFRELAEREQIVGFVVGLPVHMSGEESAKSAQARQFGAWLQQATGRPVVYYDERYTTALAEQALGAAGLTRKQRKSRLDKLAAQILLAAYLESPQRAERPRPLDD